MLDRFRALSETFRRWASMPQELSQLRRAVGRLEARQTTGAVSFREAEFQVFSQWGEDGLIQYLIRKVPLARHAFVEFGVGDYRESNTRFLLQEHNWDGLVFDSSSANVAAIVRDPIYWRHSLAAVAAFIDADNVNLLLESHGMSGDIGLLSIDIDGNDFWVWQALDVALPRIVICEFNGIFGPLAPVSVPYDPLFVRGRAHYSTVFAGASLAALYHLARCKGYQLIGTNSAGNNAFFVRDDVAGGLPDMTPAAAYSPPRFRESRHPDGSLSSASFEQARASIAECEVVDVITNRRMRVRDIPM